MLHHVAPFTAKTCHAGVCWAKSIAKQDERRGPWKPSRRLCKVKRRVQRVQVQAGGHGLRRCSAWRDGWGPPEGTPWHTQGKYSGKYWGKYSGKYLYYLVITWVIWNAFGSANFGKMTEQFWKLGSNINATNRSQRPRTDALMTANLLKVTKVIHG